jgi:hypothetical protein
MTPGRRRTGANQPMPAATSRTTKVMMVFCNAFSTVIKDSLPATGGRYPALLFCGDWKF